MASGKKHNKEAWKKFLKRHLKMSLLMIAGIITAIAAAIFVFLQVAANLQSAGLVPTMLGQWTVDFLVTFILHLIFWEIVFVASWVAPIALIIYFKWYKKLPAGERKEYEDSKSRSSDNGTMSFFASLLWLGIVWFYGFWNLPFAEWSFNDWIYTWVASWLIVLAVAGVLGTACLMYFLSTEKKLKK